MRARKRRERYWDGMRDGLVTGTQNPNMIGHPLYMRGYNDSERVFDRLVELVRLNGDDQLSAQRRTLRRS